MATQTPEKSNGAPAVIQPSLAWRPFSLFSRDPFRSIESMRQMMDSLWDTSSLADITTDVGPAMNLYETGGTYTLECALPGYKKDDISVEVRGDQVIVSGSFSQQKADDKNHYHRREIRQGAFSRAVVLPQEVNPDQVAAKLEHGMLRVELHPIKSIKSRTIPVTETE
jgi:HSP20 family protein